MKQAPVTRPSSAQPTTRPHPSHPRQPTLTAISQPPPPPLTSHYSSPPRHPGVKPALSLPNGAGTQQQPLFQARRSYPRQPTLTQSSQPPTPLSPLTSLPSPLPHCLPLPTSVHYPSKPCNPPLQMPPALLSLLSCFIPRFSHCSLVSAHSFLIAPPPFLPPTPQKIRPSCLSPARPPLGVGLARDSSPLHPPPISAAAHPPAAPSESRPQLTAPLSLPPRPRHTPSPVPVHIRSHSSSLSPLPFRPRPAAPQEFFRKNSYARKPPPSRRPCSAPPTTPIRQAAPPSRTPRPTSATHPDPLPPQPPTNLPVHAPDDCRLGLLGARATRARCAK